MNYFGIGDKLSYDDLNGIVYLLRKFKRLTSDLRIASTIESDYGTYEFSSGLTSVGGNYILEDDVTITSNDVLLNCFYTFNFTVIDVNLSGTVNRRVVSVTGGTGDNGVLEVVLEPSLLEPDEVLLPDFKVDIVFDPHEHYTPVPYFNITLSVDKEYISVGESNTVTATVVDGTGSPVEDLALQFKFNGDIVTEVTDSDGIASAEYTGTGAGWIDVVVSSESIRFYDGCMVATVTGDSITLGMVAYQSWLESVGDVIIDWGDGSTNTVNNPTTQLTHNYSDGLSNHDITFMGEVTSLGDNCFYQCTGLTSVTIPDSVTFLENYCFWACTGLTSIVIPDNVVSIGGHCFRGCTGLTSVNIPLTVTSLGIKCFYDCSALLDYDLYWTGNSIIAYDGDKMPNNTNSLFIVPVGQVSNYVSKGYPTAKLVERGYNITITADKPIIQSTETSTITAQLKHDGRVSSGKTLSYEIKHGDTTIDTGSDTTDSNGEIEIQYTGTGIGEVDIIISYSSLLQETYEILDSQFYDKGLNGTGQHNDNWTSPSNKVTCQRTNTGSVLTMSTGLTWGYWYAINNSTKFQCPIKIEYDLVNISDSPKIRFNNGTTNQGHTFSETGHYEWTITLDTVTLKIDGVTKQNWITLDRTNGLIVYFELDADTDSLTYKEFKIYSI